jgi:predicted metalloprotease
MRYFLTVTLFVMATLLAPLGVRAQSGVELIAADIDAYWAAEFAARGLAYHSPRLDEVTDPGTEFCGPIDVYYTPAGYCSPNQTIFFSTAFGSSDDLFWLPIISHEWGHHVQNLIDTGVTSAIEYELQADCFAGAFVAFAQDSDWVSPVIGALSLQLTQMAGDVWWMAPFDESIHGTSAERAVAFMAGQSGGLEACGI